jgi:hypothetical protein
MTARRSSRAQRRMDRADARSAAAPVREEIFEVGEEGMPVQDLAARLALPPGEVVKALFMKGIMVQVNQVGALSRNSALPVICIWLASDNCFLAYMLKLAGLWDICIARSMGLFPQTCTPQEIIFLTP